MTISNAVTEATLFRAASLHTMEADRYRERGGLLTDRAVSGVVDPGRAAIRSYVGMIADTAKQFGAPLRENDLIDLNLAVGDALGYRIDERRQVVTHDMFADAGMGAYNPRSLTSPATEITREMEAENRLQQVLPVRPIEISATQYQDLYMQAHKKAAFITGGQTDFPKVSFTVGEATYQMHWIGTSAEESWMHRLVGDARSIVNKAAEEMRIMREAVEDQYEEALINGADGIDWRGIGDLEVNVIPSELDWRNANFDDRLREIQRLIVRATQSNGKAGFYTRAHWDWDVEAELSINSNIGAGGDETGIERLKRAMTRIRDHQVYPKGLGASSFGPGRRRLILEIPGTITRPVSFPVAPVHVTEGLSRTTYVAMCGGGVSVAKKLGAVILDLDIRMED